MTQLDKTAIAKAYELINKFGKVLTYKSESEGVFDPSTGDFVESVTTQSFKGFITKPKTGEITSGMATIEDNIILVASKSLDIEPKANDIITINAKDITIKSINSVYSGEEICLYKLVCKLR